MDMDTSKTVLTGQIATIKVATPVMATISNAGEVAIDWARVEQEAAGSDKYLRPIAQALIAVRDKTYRPLP